MACGISELGLPLFVGHVSECYGRVFLQILVVLAATNNAEVGVVLSQAQHAQEV